MFSAIKTEVKSPRHGAIYVSPQQEAANYATGQGAIKTDMLAQIHNTGTWKQPRRVFMNLSKNAIKDLKKKHIDDPLLELARGAR